MAQERACNGQLTWASGEVQRFIRNSFEQQGLIPPEDDQIYPVYRLFERDEGVSLDARECLFLLDALLRSAFQKEASGEADRCEPLPAADGRDGGGGDGEASPVASESTLTEPSEVLLEVKAAAREAAPLWEPPAGSGAEEECAVTPRGDGVQSPASEAPGITYLGRIQVNFALLAPALAAAATANAKHLARLTRAVEDGSLARVAFQAFQACDHTGCGLLKWAEGGLPDFAAEVFRQCGLAPPKEVEVEKVYLLFDVDGSGLLDVREAVCLADALLRAVHHTVAMQERAAHRPGGLGQGHRHLAVQVSN